MIRTFYRLLRGGDGYRLKDLFTKKIKNLHVRKTKSRFSPVKWFLDGFLDSKMEGQVEKIGSSKFQSILTPEIITLSAAFIDHGYELRIIGGAVRDLLLGITPKDIDFSTNATPTEMIKLFNEKNIRYIETGLQHGTLTAHINKKDFEVTTLRIDVETDGRHAKVQYTNDWRLDAERRDLTINALSLELNGTLYDYFNGRKDIQEHRVRFVGNARSRIMEDYLRILRYFRFYGRIAVSPDNHDEKTLETIKDTAKGLKMISVERIWSELSKILTGKYAPSLLNLIYQLDVAKYIGLPDYDKTKMVEFSRVWNESQTYPLQAVTLLCTLVSSTCDAELLARDLKLSNAERNLGKFVTEHREPKKHEHSLKPYQDMLVCSPNVQAKEILRGHITELLHCQGRHQFGETISAWPIPVFPLTGEHLKKCGQKPGPEFGRTLSQLKQIWRDSYYVATEQDLIDKIKNIVKK